MRCVFPIFTLMCSGLTTSTGTPLDIEIDFLSPLPGYSYVPVSTFPISFQILNAVPAFSYGFTISFNITATATFQNTTTPSAAVAEATYVAACCSSPPPSANSSIWVWDGSGDPYHPPPFRVPTGEWNLSWDYMITNVCTQFGYMTTISNATVAASSSIEFTVGTNISAQAGGSGVQDCVVGGVVNITKDNQLDNCAILGSSILNLPSTCGAGLQLGDFNSGAIARSSKGIMWFSGGVALMFQLLMC